MSLVGIFKQQNLEANSQFETFARGLVRVLTPATPRNTVFTGAIKYKLLSEALFRVRIPQRPNVISRVDEIIPDPDSIPLSVLNHPPGKRLEINFAAYDPPEIALSPSEETHSVSVPCPNAPLEILTVE